MICAELAFIGPDDKYHDGVPDEDDPEPLDPTVTGKGSGVWLIVVVAVIVVAVLAAVMLWMKKGRKD